MFFGLIFIILLCYIYKKRHDGSEDIVANKDIIQLEDFKEEEKSQAIVMSDEVFFANDSTVASPPIKKTKRNRRVRARQHL